MAAVALTETTDMHFSDLYFNYFTTQLLSSRPALGVKAVQDNILEVSVLICKVLVLELIVLVLLVPWEHGLDNISTS